MNTRTHSLRRLGSLFLVSALGTFLLLRPATAVAGWRRQNANAICRIVTNVPLPPDFAPLAPHEIRNPQPWNYLRLICPVVDINTGFEKASFTSMSLAVTDNSTSLGAKVMTCVSFITMAGGTCGAESQTGAASTGPTTLAVTLGASSVFTAANASNFGYLVVNLPPKDFTTSAVSSFRGIYTTN